MGMWGNRIVTILTLLFLASFMVIVAGFPVAAEPSTAAEWFTEGNNYSNQGRYEGALYAFDQAISLNPDYAKAYFAKGQILAVTGQHSEAVMAYETAVALDPPLGAVVESYLQVSEGIIYPEIPSGSLVTGFWTSGWGYLTIDNRAGDHDIVVAFSPIGVNATVTAVYVKKGYYHSFEGIVPPGDYDIYVTFGEKWNAKEKRFVTNAGYLKWTLPQSFRGSYGNGYTMVFIPQTYYYSSWYVKNLDPVAESEFPAL